MNFARILFKSVKLNRVYYVRALLKKQGRLVKLWLKVSVCWNKGQTVKSPWLQTSLRGIFDDNNCLFYHLEPNIAWNISWPSQPEILEPNKEHSRYSTEIGVTRSKFEANQSRVSGVMTGHTCKTNRQIEITTLCI